MTEYNEGDLVEAICGESLIRDRLVKRLDSLAFGTSGGTIQWYENLGWGLTVIEKAPPKVVLPTKPWIYQDAGKRLWMRGEDCTDISPQPFWWEVDSGLTGIPTDLPLTPLEPASETAKKVLDRVEQFWLGGVTVWAALVNLRHDFGVTE